MRSIPITIYLTGEEFMKMVSQCRKNRIPLLLVRNRSSDQRSLAGSKRLTRISLEYNEAYLDYLDPMPFIGFVRSDDFFFFRITYLAEETDLTGQFDKITSAT